MWDYATESYLDTKLQFCGLVMGDHSKCGINTMFNTGSVVGVSASVFGAGFPHKYIPSFTWGGVDSFDDFKLDQALLVAERALARRGMVLDEVESSILSHIYEITAKFRHLKQQF